MMGRLRILLLTAAWLAALGTFARAQPQGNQTGYVLTSCGTIAGQSAYAAGQSRWFTLDANGNMCITGTVTTTLSGSTSNAASGVATSSTNIPTVAYSYGFNGTTWDQLQVDASKSLKVIATPSSAAGAANTISATTVAASNSVLKGSAGNLYSLTVTVGATAGWVMVFDTTVLPSNGATGATLKWCYPVNSDGTKGGIDKVWNTPIPFATGITAVFSSTACNSLTASSTAFFYGAVQ